MYLGRKRLTFGRIIGASWLAFLLFMSFKTKVKENPVFEKALK
jgi:hypothetical protein